MDLVSRLEFVDRVIAERRRDAHDHAVARLAMDRHRAESPSRPSLADRLSIVFGRTTEPATCLCV